MQSILMNIFAMSGGKFVTRGRSIVRVRNALVAQQQDLGWAVLTVATPFAKMVVGSAEFLMLDRQGCPYSLEAHANGHSNAQVNLDIWPRGPMKGREYVVAIEDLARRGWAELLQSGNGKRMMAFSRMDAQAVAEELSMRVLVSADEVEYDDPEHVLVNEQEHMRHGNLDALPALLRPEGGQPVQLKAVRSCQVVKVHKYYIRVQSGRQLQSIQVPAGLKVSHELTPGKRLQPGQAFFRFPANVDVSNFPLVDTLLKALHDKMFLDLTGKKLLRVRYATKVPHRCFACGHSTGVHKVAELICPQCGMGISSPRDSGGVHLPVDKVKPDTELECASCHCRGFAELFRKHRVCQMCGAAAAPALKSAFAACNSRNYCVSPVSVGFNIPIPSEISFVKSFSRRTNLQELSEAARKEGRRVTIPPVYRVA